MSLQCHFGLSVAKPAPESLTDFYLWVSVGGAFGGIFNAFIVPFVFPLPLEFFFIALLGCWVNSGWAKIMTKKFDKIAYASAFLAFLSVIGMVLLKHEPTALLLSMVVLASSVISASFKPKLFVVVAPLLGAISFMYFDNAKLLHVERNFFGVLKVYDMPYTQFVKDSPNSKEKETIRVLFHGATIHGVEDTNPEAEPSPNSYYHAKGPLGDVMSLRDWRDVGIIGMGSGNTTCYKSAGRKYAYYEIDSAVPAVAKEWFNFVRECGAPEIKIGDGRKLMESANGVSHDLIIIDAFTSDAIPAHLLTKEAFQTYLERLKNDGVIMAHISNRFYDLRGQLSAIAKNMGLNALFKKYKPSEEETLSFATPSVWVALSRNESSIKDLRSREWEDLPNPDSEMWTDDYSNVLSSMMLFRNALGR